MTKRFLFQTYGNSMTGEGQNKGCGKMIAHFVTASFDLNNPQSVWNPYRTQMLRHIHVELYIRINVSMTSLNGT